MPSSSADELVHALLVGFSAVVLSISVLAFAKRRTKRYLFLTLAFAFLASSQSVALVESVFLSNQLVIVPLTGIHLSHFLDFLMMSSFAWALLAKTGVES